MAQNNSDRIRLEVIRSCAKLDLALKKDYLHHIHILSEDAALLYTKQKPSSESDRSVNVVITALINAKARLLLLEKVRELETKDYAVIYCDTDMIVFERPEDRPFPPFMKMGYSYGDFQRVHSSIKSFRWV